MPQNIFSGIIDYTAFAGVKTSILSALDFLAPFSTVFSLILLVGIVYCFIRIEHIVHATKHEDEVHGHGGGDAHGHGATEETLSEKRWERVQSHLNSDRESDWRLAILEADVLLDEMVTTMGYHGDSLGEKLKGIEKSDFTTLDFAWEAHAVRNRIAHEGVAFTLTEREAKRVSKLYEDVFNEFKYI